MAHRLDRCRLVSLLTSFFRRTERRSNRVTGATKDVALVDGVAPGTQ
ncbi:hypothetical protein Rhow_001916 [Rhodococcus wratislaviensis]|uniref:Uncharacterized protein n=1 Tax=Rhodococcus wratislaviensis TaxID=44752 RepID=A0A402BYY1_RHOWR|nr:hypothetical protein Rhow_001916 [Rhodococcus wratislaviensis]